MYNKIIWQKTIFLLITGMLCLALPGCGRDEIFTLEDFEERTDAYGQTPGAEDEMAVDVAVPNMAALDASEEADIYVYVCGAVKNPGVVKLPAGARVCSALELAGGFLPQADAAAVNLARVLRDGEEIYFPTTEETAQGSYELLEVAQGEQDALVDINTADEAMLCTLPGIGQTRARAIVEYRTQHGLFGSIEELMNVNGIGEASFAKLKSYITISK